jgi:hypothetical protein
VHGQGPVRLYGGKVGVAVHDLLTAAGLIVGAWIVLGLAVGVAMGATLRRLSEAPADMPNSLEPAQQREFVVVATTRH